ncbi:MAG: hypothetical protein K9G59_09825 [Caulobacter sp.]|nr:hypothetical protein [Caulobacter sp.]
MKEPKVQRGHRTPCDGDVFSSPPIRPGITPDRVSPAIEGYFHLPPIWVGTKPDEQSVAVLNPAIHHQIVFERDLSFGVRVKAQRDGMFLFDFSKWPLAPITLIPGFVVDDPSAPYMATKEHQDAENLAEDRAAFRAQLMNVHQGCLATAQFRIKRGSMPLGLPVKAHGAHKGLTFDVRPGYYEQSDDVRSVAKNVANNSYNINRDKPQNRRIVDIPVVARSFDILEKILSFNDPSIIQLFEAAYISACRAGERRYGESVVVGWSVCEQLVSIAWRRLIDSLNSSPEAPRAPKERRKKLLGRDYTASVMVEMLEVNGIIDHELYRNLEISRKSRNAWAHEMRPPGEHEVYRTRISIENLMAKVLGVDWCVHNGAGGGVPQWPVWMWEAVEGKRK